MKKETKDMDCIRAYKFRLAPDKKRQEAIDNSIILSQQLYNKLLEKTINAHKENPNSKISQKTINAFMNQITKEDKRYMELYAHIRVDIRNRILKTYQNFFRRCKKGERKKGFPRFRSRDKYKSITHIENNGSFRIEKDRLRVSKIGTMKIIQHRKIEGIIKTLTIKKEAGKYYAIFTAIQDINPPQAKDTNPIGIDVGLETFATFSDGKKIQKPNFKKNAQKGVTKWQRIVARRKKGSNRRQKAKNKLQVEYQKWIFQQNDYLHKITDDLVNNSGYTSFAMEKLQIQNMQKNHYLANAISGASWSRFKELLSYKAESAGLKVYEVDPRNTSKICSNCGNIQDMPLSERTYNCNRCGMEKGRDENSAINILNRAREGHSQSHAQGDNVRPQQVATVNELRTILAGGAVHV